MWQKGKNGAAFPVFYNFEKKEIYISLWTDGGHGFTLYGLLVRYLLCTAIFHALHGR